MLPRTVTDPVAPGTGVTSPLPSTDSHGIRIDLEPHWGGEVILARVTGELDLLSTPVLQQWIAQHAPRSRSQGFVLDMRDVDFFSAAGLGVLTELADHAAHHGVPWALVADTRIVLRPLYVTGLEQRLPLYRSVVDALDAVRDSVHTA